MASAKENLEQAMDMLRTRTGIKYTVERVGNGEFGKWRIIYWDNAEQLELGPRLPIAQLVSWLGGYLDGFEAGNRKGTFDGIRMVGARP